MKFNRFVYGGEPRIGVVEKNAVTDITDSVASYAALLETVIGGDAPPTSGPERSPEEIDLLPPTTDRSHVYAAALNYEAHVEETETAVPEWPLVFLKLPQTLVAHGDPISLSEKVTSALDYEAELAAVVGKRARHLDPDESRDVIAGYTILNDITARDVQRMTVGDDEYLDWFSAKMMARTTPVGPHVVDADSIDDPQDLRIQSLLNGELMQDANTGLMIRSVDELVSFVSSRVELQPGDVIATGTPEGVGAFQDITLADGDTVSIRIEGIGELENTVGRP